MRQKELAVLVHGFGSSPRCWDVLLDLFDNDHRITSRFDLKCFGYGTSVANWSRLRRIPRLAESANDLQSFLASSFPRYKHVTLIGHSQGGLVIQTYLARKIQSGDYEDDLARIRQVILIATPSLGSTILSGLRKVIFTLFANPQERALRTHDPELADVVHVIDERVESIRPNDRRGWPIPIHCFSGTRDAIVTEASARGPFDCYTSVDADHFSILQPPDRHDPRYTRLADALLQPLGHKCIWEVEVYETRIAVNPLHGFQQDIVGCYGPHTRAVHTENVAHVTRSVKFSRENRCKDLFTLRYLTQGNGYVSFVPSHENEATSQELSNYENYGYEALFRFTPNGTDTFTLQADVYKGFDEGNRDVHFHLGKRTSYVKRLRYVVDLRAFLNDGYCITSPELYFRSRDNGHELCKQRVLGAPVACQGEDPVGVWQWELQDIREGIVDIIWDVNKPPTDRTTDVLVGP